MIFSEEQLERYSRHFALKEIGVAGQKRLLQSRVLVIGAGALGSSSLLYLAAAGVGTLGIADYDQVELSNLQRQILHRTKDVGTDKTQSARQTIEEHNPDVSVQLHPERMTVDNILDVIGQYDFIIDATDRFESKFLINDACVLAKKPYSHAGVVRFEGQTMTYVPGKGPCLRCLLGSVPPAEETLTCSQAGVLGAVTGIIGSIQAAEAIKYLLEIGDLLVGKVLNVDGLRMQFHTTCISKSNPDCSVCGEHPSILTLADNRAEYQVTGCGM
ncbi:MAG: HesA/MoeB/ThiF family protein [Lachnospiraceae bacterium]|nr:HesA/MoeB/ThiF family protein [Lachnospiraceae bacterium]